MIKLPKVGGRRVGDWMRLRLGDKVYNKADPRHIGEVRAIRNGYIAKVVWDETGWISWVELADLVKERER